MAVQLTRRETSAVTRRRLIDAAIELLREAGPAAATTGRIARAAGLAQASFYAHFRDRDACLGAAAHEIGEHVLARLRGALLPIDARDLRGSIRRVYAALLDVFAADRELTLLFIAHRADASSPLGEGLRASLARARADLVTAIRLYGVRPSAAEAACYAELLVSVMLGLAESVLAGRVERELGLDAVADVTYGALRALLPLEEPR
ncbi:MAG: TetR/AcrR family transcriptional regulator [Deltaproteobacteria bacterium]|nr:TetR/AcrR family transcriptional regulator [Kofleriaceae bacterium]